MLAVSTLGVLYMVEKGGETVTDIKSLAGKTIYATGKGATPEYALTYLLARNGLELGKDVNVEWKSEPTEIVAQMAAQDSAVAMLPQPFVVVAMGQVEGLRVALDLTEQWNALGGDSQLITAVLLVRSEFLDQHPQAVDQFMKEYAAPPPLSMTSLPRPPCWWKNTASSRPPWPKRPSPPATSSACWETR